MSTQMLGHVAIVAAGVLLAGFVLHLFSGNSLAASVSAGFQGQ
jgi:hypothetical protein